MLDCVEWWNARWPESNSMHRSCFCSKDRDQISSTILYFEGFARSPPHSLCCYAFARRQNMTAPNIIYDVLIGLSWPCDWQPWTLYCKQPRHRAKSAVIITMSLHCAVCSKCELSTENVKYNISFAEYVVHSKKELLTLHSKNEISNTLYHAFYVFKWIE